MLQTLILAYAGYKLAEQVLGGKKHGKKKRKKKS